MNKNIFYIAIDTQQIEGKSTGDHHHIIVFTFGLKALILELGIVGAGPFRILSSKSLMCLLVTFKNNEGGTWCRRALASCALIAIFRLKQSWCAS